MRFFTELVLVLTGIVIGGSIIFLIDNIVEMRTVVRMMNERIEYLDRDIKNMNRPISVNDISSITNGHVVIIGRDPLDNMPMLVYGQGQNGEICPL